MLGRRCLLRLLRLAVAACCLAKVGSSNVTGTGTTTAARTSAAAVGNTTAPQDCMDPHSSNYGRCCDQVP